jgi:nitrogen fixation/metabolism regulation signal transduction histidine kinase
LFFNISRNNKYFKGLYNNFNEIIKNFRLVRIEKEIEHHFFKETVEHVGSGLLAYDDQGDIRLINKAALNLLNLERLSNINNLDVSYPDLSDTLITIMTDGQHFLKLPVGNEPKHISVRVSEIKLGDDRIKLLALQDISREIDKSEVEAWQKLIRVLTHEIMNTVSPINLLSGSLINIFEENGKRKPLAVIDDQSIENALLGLHTILKRSSGLAKFIETYRNLTKIPEPSIAIFKVNHIFNPIRTLLVEDLRKADIELSISITPPDLTLIADEKLVEQVLINLIKNSMEALENVDKSSIFLNAFKNKGSVCITVTDNGKGIPSEILENIFVPFFSTKKNGSGVGLSISRQIMQMHNGTIKLKSESGKGTVFTLEF